MASQVLKKQGNYEGKSVEMQEAKEFMIPAVIQKRSDQVIF